MNLVRTTPVVKGLIIVSVAAFVIQMFGDTFMGTHLFDVLGLVPYRFFEHFQVWQLVTYMFVHADVLHILFNMLVLWMIGSELEAQWGKAFFLKFYFLCGMVGGLFYLGFDGLFRTGAHSLVPVVGSSGAVYGLLVAYGILYSERVMLFMMIFPMKARHFVLVLGAMELATTVFGSRGGIANLAHLGGMVAGFAYLALSAALRIRQREKAKPKKKAKRPGHLKLVINNQDVDDFDTDDQDGGGEGGGRPFYH